MDATRFEEILKELETEAGQTERRLWLSPDGELAGTKAGLYALAADLLRATDKRDVRFVGGREDAIFAGRLGGVSNIGLREEAAELEREAARRERTIVWAGRFSVAAVAVLGLLFLFFFWMWWFRPF